MRAVRGRGRAARSRLQDQTTMTNAVKTVDRETQTEDCKLTQQLQRKVGKQTKELGESKLLSEKFETMFHEREKKADYLERKVKDLEKEVQAANKEKHHSNQINDLRKKLKHANDNNEELRKEVRALRLVTKGLEYDNMRLNNERSIPFQQFELPDQNQLNVETYPENSKVIESIIVTYPKNRKHIHRTYKTGKVLISSLNEKIELRRHGWQGDFWQSLRGNN